MFANDSILVYVYECPYYMKGSNLKLAYCGEFMMLQMNRVTSLCNSSRCSLLFPSFS